MTVSMTDSAASRIAWLLAREPDPQSARLRISVQGGGCSGFQYQYDFENGPGNDDDTMLEKNGARVSIDAVSLDIMKDSVIDYVEDLSGASFEIRNPNSTAKCGCGNSFSVM